MKRQQPIPDNYRSMSPLELDRSIEESRETLGKDLVILGHHYQRDEIIKFADFRGDSFKLSQLAAGRSEAEFIVFCGVHFMAESADILSSAHQTVILPNLTAGCSMADMAGYDDVMVAWEHITDACGPSVIPVTYMNSAADLKAFCGEHGGIVCTSSNAPQILRWAFERGEKVLFFPDEHLGRNTADKIGLPKERVAVWDPRDVSESTMQAAEASLIVWKGFCSVHERFSVDQIRQARRTHPGCTVIVHPECRREVVQAADSDGSTEFIIAEIERAPAGTTFAVGTEVNLVNRLAAEHPEMTIFCLDPVVCPCSTMYRIHPAYLAWVLDELVEGRVMNQIKVGQRTATYARTALNRMLDVGAQPLMQDLPAPAAVESMSA
jgi:quinolinate synthase